MTELVLSNLGGFMNQMYTPNPNVLKENQTFLSENYFDINALFWNDFFSEQKVLTLINILCDRNKFSKDINLSTKEKVILQDPQMFLKHYKNAKKHLLDTNLSAEQTYQFLEIFEMICMLHTFLISSPFKINIENGFLRSKYSSYEMFYNCLLPYRNPYFEFINEKIIPVISKYKPETIWFLGQPNIATFTIARIIKQILPSTFFIICAHSSEFYSMNKIIPLLKQNNILFNIFNCVVLDNNRSTIEKIRKSLINKSSLTEISDILFTIDGGNTIIQTPTARITTQEEIVNVSELNIKSNFPINIKLFPQNHCYWKKCSFCGINAKYLCPSLEVWDINFAFDTLKKYVNKGVNNFWLLDEAIPPNVLYDLSCLIIKEKMHINWHARSRVDESFTSELICKTFLKAGLKHILFGFESASKRILDSMNKTELPNYLDVSENIVKNMSKYSISVHFPAIVGYPTETYNERKETYDFLEYLYSTYALFSYNINIFNLDITSKIFREWTTYNITEIHFPCEPKYFLENSLEWDCSFLPIDRQVLEDECEKEMLKRKRTIT